MFACAPYGTPHLCFNRLAAGLAVNKAAGMPNKALASWLSCVSLLKAESDKPRETCSRAFVAPGAG